MGTEADAHLEFIQNGSGQIRRASMNGETGLLHLETQV